MINDDLLLYFSTSFLLNNIEGEGRFFFFGLLDFFIYWDTQRRRQRERERKSKSTRCVSLMFSSQSACRDRKWSGSSLLYLKQNRSGIRWGRNKKERGGKKDGIVFLRGFLLWYFCIFVFYSEWVNWVCVFYIPFEKCLWDRKWSELNCLLVKPGRKWMFARKAASGLFACEYRKCIFNNCKNPNSHKISPKNSHKIYSKHSQTPPPPQKLPN